METVSRRDIIGSFEPVLTKKGQKRFNGFYGKFLSMYAPGKTALEIQGYLEDIYAVEVSPNLIFQCHRFSYRESSGLAEPPIGCNISHRIYGRLAGED
jgi:hypothetical protein